MMADGSVVLEPLETEVDQQSSEAVDSSQQSTESSEYNPFESKSARELSQWLKGIRDADPNNAKYARALKDVFGQQYAFKKEFPSGIEEVRGMKALVDSVIHQGPDGNELRGAEAISALQDSVREYAQIDELLATGDPRALESLGDEFNDGLAKLAPSILDRIKGSDPEAYANAVLPHFVDALSKSDLVQNFNGLVDVLNEQPPNWLTDQQKQAWGKDQMQKVISLAANMGKWFSAQAEKVKGSPQVTQNGKPKADPVAQREAEFNRREQDHHWNTSIAPNLDQHAAQTFSKLFAPFAKRLNLDAPTANALKMEFSKRVASEAAKDKAYMGQIGRYRSMRNPDPATVTNFAKVQFDKHAPNVLKSLIDERYKPFLNGKPRATVAPTNGSKPAVKGDSVQYVTVKPANIDYKNTPLAWLHQKQYRTTDGKVVKVRNA
jgi:hypothetical protein